MDARHTYEDWCRHCETGNVGIIIEGNIKTPFIIQWFGGKKERVGIYEFDPITEYEYYKMADPRRCGADIPLPEPLRECLFTGKMIQFPKRVEGLF